MKKDIEAELRKQCDFLVDVLELPTNIDKVKSDIKFWAVKDGLKDYSGHTEAWVKRCLKENQDKLVYLHLLDNRSFYLKDAIDKKIKDIVQKEMGDLHTSMSSLVNMVSDISTKTGKST